jgi:hypothetical protein
VITNAFGQGAELVRQPLPATVMRPVPTDTPAEVIPAGQLPYSRVQRMVPSGASFVRYPAWKDTLRSAPYAGNRTPVT